MSYREKMELNSRVESFIARKTMEHPEIIKLEKWIRYEYTPPLKHSVRKRLAKK